MATSQPEVSGGWRRFYRDVGEGSDVVVFIHGIPTHHILWSRTISKLGPTVRAIAPDLTGFGLSDLPTAADLSPAGQAIDILNFLERLNVRRFTLVGHDFGALVAIEMLGMEPDRVDGLIISNTSLRRRDWAGSGINPLRLIRLPGVGELGFRLARRWMLRLAFLPFVEERQYLDSRILSGFWEAFEHGYAETLLRLWRGQSFDELDERRWREALRLYEGPVSIIWGARDPVFRVDIPVELVELMPQARVVVLRNSNHFVPIDRPAVLARLITLQVEAKMDWSQS